MRNLLFRITIVLSLISANLLAQTSIGKYKYYAIKDTYKQSTEDSIRFVISGNKDKKPLILFIQGSGNNSILLDNKELLIRSFIPDSLFEKYHFVLISKAGVPIIDNANDYSTYSRSRGDFKKFTENNFLDYYVSSVKQVLDFTKSLSFIDNSKVFIIGHSQGYHVAAKFAARYPNLYSKVICMSGNPFGGVPAIHMRKIRQDMLIGKISDSIANLKIDTIKQDTKTELDYLNHGKPIKYDESYLSCRNNLSFDLNFPIYDFLKINKPILIIYSTRDQNDNAVLDNDIVPLFFVSAGKKNLNTICYPNYDHNYFYREYNAKGEMVKEEFNWPKVFIDIDKWIKK